MSIFRLILIYNDRELVVAAISRVNILFVSYVEKYGSSTTGGLYFYFGERDAEYVIAVRAAALLSLGSAATAAVGAAICIAVATFYWVAQNNDGSLDVLHLTQT